MTPVERPLTRVERPLRRVERPLTLTERPLTPTERPLTLTECPLTPMEQSHSVLTTTRAPAGRCPQGCPQATASGLRTPARRTTLAAMTDPAAPLDLPAVLRALRRRADVSQRALAANSGVPAATVGRIESGASPNPQLRTVERLVRATGARLAIVDLDGTEPEVLDTDHWRDRAERRFPPHLDPRPMNRWRRGRAEDVISFLRRRWRRDYVRRMQDGELRWDAFTEIRRLGPGDADVLATLHAEAAEFSLAGAPAPAGPAVTGPEAVRYLRDPALRHWVAETGARFLTEPEVSGHLVAYLLRRSAGPPALLVTEFGIRPEHRDGPVGPLLLAALGAEAARWEVGETVALAGDPALAGYLARFGFERRPARPVLLRVPG